MKKIFVTGASGFIGKHCLSLLVNEGYEVHATTRSEIDQMHKSINWHQLDLFDVDKLDELISNIKPEILLHLAWKVQGGLNFDSDENKKWFELSKQLIDIFLSNSGKRIVVTGSCFEYDQSSGFMSENLTPTKSNSKYGIYKDKLRQFIEQKSKKSDFSYSWPRIFFTFGPGQKKTSLVPYLIAKMAESGIVETTDGKQIYDYVYVEDVAKAIVLIVGSDYQGPVNICSGKGIKLKDLILKIATKMNGVDLIKFGSKERPKGSPSIVTGSNDILVKEIGWEEKYDLDKAIDKTIKYFTK